MIGLFVWFINGLLKRLNEENTFKTAPQTFDNPLSLSPVWGVGGWVDGCGGWGGGAGGGRVQPRSERGLHCVACAV